MWLNDGPLGGPGNGPDRGKFWYQCVSNNEPTFVDHYDKRAQADDCTLESMSFGSVVVT